MSRRVHDSTGTSTAYQHPHNNQSSNQKDRYQTYSQRQITLLSKSLSTLSTTTSAATSRCSDLTLRAVHLDSLTSPASDASAALTQASSNLTATLALLKDAREKYDTVGDCEPAIDRLSRGAQEALDARTSSAYDYGTVAGGTVAGGNYPRRGDEGVYNIPNDNNHSVIDLGGRMATRRNLMNINDNNTARWNDDDTMTLGGGTTGGNTLGGGTIGGGTVLGLTEQDVYAAADSMEILRDAHTYFQKRLQWKSAHLAMNGLERVHKVGVEGMCTLVKSHLIGAGPGIRFKRRMYSRERGDAGTVMTRGESTIVTTGTFAAQSTQVNVQQEESASDTRARLSAALQIRDLMRAVGEYEEHLPLDTRTVRELRAVFECLGGDNWKLPPDTPTTDNLSTFQIEPNKLRRSEKTGSGYYTNLVNVALSSGYPHLDAYAYARRRVVFQSMDNYYRQLKVERRKHYTTRQMLKTSNMYDNHEASGELDAGARDCVRCIEHAMVIVSGEKSIYRCVVSPTASQTHEDALVPQKYKKALVASYSHVVSTVVDRIMDVVELFFVKDAGLRQSTITSSPMAPGADGLTGDAYHNDGDSAGTRTGTSVRITASAAAAVLRILDGVRLLGPSLSRLCDLSSSTDKRRTLHVEDDADDGNGDLDGDGDGDKKGFNRSRSAMLNPGNQFGPTLASSLCIAMHRTAVKSAAKSLENLAAAIKDDPIDGENFRPGDARVAAVSSDAVRAMRLVSPFVSAYKSVTKRRTLPWDPKVGEAAGDMESFIRFLTMTLLSNLEKKAKKYSHDPGLSSQAKSYLFLMNNTFYLLEQLGPTADVGKANPFNMRKEFRDLDDFDGADYKIEEPWFKDQVNRLFEASKMKYLTYWEVLNKHLAPVPKNDLQYQNVEQRVLSRDSGRVLKARFSGFNEKFEETYRVHRELTVIDPKLREWLLEDVKAAFLHRYRGFYAEYSKVKFSKKNTDEYLKYPPGRVESMMSDLFSL